MFEPLTTLLVLHPVLGPLVQFEALITGAGIEWHYDANYSFQVSNPSRDVQ